MTNNSNTKDQNTVKTDESQLNGEDNATKTQEQNPLETAADEINASFDPDFNAETEANDQKNAADLELLSTISTLEQKVAQLEKQDKERGARTQAEIDNIRRRAAADVEKAHKFALEKFAKEIITTIDNLERALMVEMEQTDNIKPLTDGVELTLKELLTTVSKFGIKAVGVAGETFNPDIHQAISMQPSEGFSTNQITQVLQKGYLLNDRVIRPAMVMVAS